MNRYWLRLFRIFLVFNLLEPSAFARGFTAASALQGLSLVNEEAVVAPLITDHRIGWRDTVDRLLVAQGLGRSVVIGVLMIVPGSAHRLSPEPTVALSPSPIQIFSRSVEEWIDVIYRLHDLATRSSKSKPWREIQALREEVLTQRDHVHREFRKQMITVDAKRVAGITLSDERAMKEIDEGKQALRRYHNTLRAVDETLSEAAVALGEINPASVIHEDLRFRDDRGAISDVPLIDELRFEPELASLQKDLQQFDRVDPKSQEARSAAADAVRLRLEILTLMPSSIVDRWAKEWVAKPWKHFKSYLRKVEKQRRALTESA